MNCKECKYGYFEGNGNGECHRNPPTLAGLLHNVGHFYDGEPDDSKGWQMDGVWPIVFGDDEWCGEFESKPEETVENEHPACDTDFRDSPIAWFAAMLRGFDTEDYALVGEAQQQLMRLGFKVTRDLKGVQA